MFWNDIFAGTFQLGSGMICKGVNGWQLAKMKKSIPDTSLP